MKRQEKIIKTYQNSLKVSVKTQQNLKYKE